jgi:hypothetical protein
VLVNNKTLVTPPDWPQLTSQVSVHRTWCRPPEWFVSLPQSFMIFHVNWTRYTCSSSGHEYHCFHVAVRSLIA